MHHSIPIIGLVGGIASGKSFWAREFAAAGCRVVDADALVSEIYRRPGVLAQLAEWWGADVRHVDGSLNRSAVAKIIFNHPAERVKLEHLIHPLVMAAREEMTAQAIQDSQVASGSVGRVSAQGPAVRAVVWDIPLLLEVGLGPSCDTIVYVDAPQDIREARAAGRGWSKEELAKREGVQTSLGDKRAAAQFVLPPATVPGRRSASPAEAVRQILTDITTQSV